MIQTWAATAGLFVIALNLALCSWRALRGPSHFDRVMAFDAIALNVVGATILLSIILQTNAFMDFVLVVALLGFLGTVALAAYLEGSLVD
jgi:multicomponent Na+:H+ antiporter subunit F